MLRLSRLSSPFYYHHQQCYFLTHQFFALSFCNTKQKFSTKVEIKVGDVTHLLNSIASRYASLSRVIMEYVDNSLDDAESQFRKNNFHYTKHSDIDVIMSRKNRTVSIRDNGNGMTYEQLINLITNVGQSEKKNVKWLNGQFGFGFHSFRAAAAQASVVTRIPDCDYCYSVVLSRKHNTAMLPKKINIKIPSLEMTNLSDFQTLLAHNTSGTIVRLENIDFEWFRGNTAEKIAMDIESHFERILARPNLCIRVSDVDKAFSLQCNPFNYDALETSFEVQKNLKLPNGTIEINLKVLKSQGNEIVGYGRERRRARIFCLGREIAEIGRIDSFMRLSKYRQSLWGHPQLVGYIEVNNALDPVITRDEFPVNKNRRKLYNELLKLENILKEAIDKEMSRIQETQFHDLGSAMLDTIENVMKENNKQIKREEREIKRAIMQEASAVAVTIPTTDTKKNNVKKNSTKKLSSVKKKTLSPFESVQFVNLSEEQSKTSIRFLIGDRQIMINTAHPDFISRVRVKQGKPVIDDRLAYYISTICGATCRILVDEKDGGKLSKRKFGEEIINDTISIDRALRKILPKLMRGEYNDIMKTS